MLYQQNFGTSVAECFHCYYCNVLEFVAVAQSLCTVYYSAAVSRHLICCAVSEATIGDGEYFKGFVRKLVYEGKSHEET